MYTDPKRKKYFKTSGEDDARDRKGFEGKAPDKRAQTSRPARYTGNNPAKDIRPPRKAVQYIPEDAASGVQDTQGARDGREPTADRLEGRNPVLEALRAGRTINKLWVARQEGGRIDPTAARIVAMAKERGVFYNEVPRTTLDQMSQTHNHQGVIAQVASHDYAELEAVISSAREKGEAPFLLMLDELKDAYNLGSILRIADAAGVHGVIIPRHRSIGLDSMVAKASAGAIEYVPVSRVTNLSQTIAALKEDGFWVAGTDAEGTISYDKADFTGPLLIVIGSEGEGMAKNIRDKCDFLLSIPMSGHVNSLNAAVAAGIVVFEAQKQRLAAK